MNMSHKTNNLVYFIFLFFASLDHQPDNIYLKNFQEWAEETAQWVIKCLLFKQEGWSLIPRAHRRLPMLSGLGLAGRLVQTLHEVKVKPG